MLIAGSCFCRGPAATRLLKGVQPTRVAGRTLTKTHPLKPVPSPYSPLSSARRKLLSSALVAGVGGSAFVLATTAYTQPVECRARSRRSTDEIHELKDEDAKFDWGLFLRLLSGQSIRLLAAVVAAVAAAALNILIPSLLGDLTNILASIPDTGACVADVMRGMREPAVNLLCAYSGQALATTLYIHWLSVAGEKMASQLRILLFQSLVNQDIAFFDTHRTGELVSRISNDVQSFKSSFKQCISQGLRNTTQIAGCVYSLYSISPALTALMGVILPTVIAAGSAFGAMLRALSRSAEEELSKAISIADEALSNVRTVRAFSMEEKEVQLLADQAAQSEHATYRLGLGIAAFQGASNLVLNSLVLSVLFYGGRLLADNRLSAGDLMAFLVSTQMIQRSLSTMSVLFGQVVRGMTSGARVFHYINCSPELQNTGTQRLTDGRPPEVRFSGVTFTYPSRPQREVLHGLDLTVSPGQTVALVGPSGTGKSTIAALLERFYDPTSGRITIDGVDIRDLDSKWLRGELIGYISQEPVLFATSIKENIRYGKPSASDDEVLAAAKKANALDFIQDFPNGFSTVLGERGVTVSGGQKQRIAIARALIKNPRVLILDEATSALDSQSELIVQETLEKISEGLTVLVVAHRLSTVQRADCIVVFDSEGNVVEKGTHDQLLRVPGGQYQTLVQSQLH